MRYGSGLIWEIRMSIEAMKQALEALEISASCVDPYYVPVGKSMIPEVETAIDVLSQAIEQAEKREWVGLTDEEIKEIVGNWGDTPIKGYTRKLFDQIETKLKGKNHVS
jgi:hypothetical protein